MKNTSIDFSSCDLQSVIDYQEDRLQIYWTSVEHGFHLQQLNLPWLRKDLEGLEEDDEVKECGVRLIKAGVSTRRAGRLPGSGTGWRGVVPVCRGI